MSTEKPASDPVSRRDFLAATAATGIALGAGTTVPALAQAPTQAPSTTPLPTAETAQTSEMYEGSAAGAVLAQLRAAGVRMLRRQVLNRPALTSWSALLDYCTAAMACSETEQFRILFLDRKNNLIADEVQQQGTVDVREVVKRALELSASAIILVHNHPSGDPTPSRADIEITRKIVEAADKLSIAVHDHLIIGRGGHASFRGLKLL